MCKLQNYGKVVSIEIDEQFGTPKHQKLTAIIGDSISDDVKEKVYKQAKETALVILDSDHSPEHIYKELVAYAPLVHIGGYIIVEDALQQNGIEGVNKFLAENTNFKTDKEIERYGIHAACDGFLKRVE
jgi:cephalosporin hydroxylase